MCAASLIKTGEKISDVCEKTGFNDQHYFSQLFKKTFGCTPSNYRNENGENFPGLYEILNSKSGMESDMRRRDKLKQTGVLKTNGSLMNKILKSICC